MVKQVFDNAQCAHVWASRSQEEGRTSTNNMFFIGDTIYSYGRHFPMAMFYRMDNGQQVVFENDDSYSVSTSRHQSYVRRALSGERYDIIQVDTNALKVLAESHRDYHKKAIEEYLTRRVNHIEILAKTLKRSRKYAEQHLSAINQTRAQASTLARLFKIRSNPVEKLFNTGTIDEIADKALKRQAESRKKYEQEREKARKKAEQLWLEEAPKWKRGEVAYIPAMYEQFLHDKPTMLRLKDGRIETSRKAVVTEAAGCKLFKLWRMVMQGMDPFKPGTIYCKGMYLNSAETNTGYIPINAKTSFAATEEDVSLWNEAWMRWEADHGVHRVDHFELRWIDFKGNTKIGCHLLTRAEIDDFLNRVGWVNGQETDKAS